MSEDDRNELQDAIDNMGPEDWKAGSVSAKIVIVTAVVAVIVFLTHAWPGAIPMFNRSRPEAMILARYVCSVGLAIAAAALGLERPSAIPVTLRAFPTILAIAAMFFCSKWYTDEAEDLDFWAAVAFAAPSVVTYTACTLIRIGLRLRGKQDA